LKGPVLGIKPIHLTIPSRFESRNHQNYSNENKIQITQNVQNVFNQKMKNQPLIPFKFLLVMRIFINLKLIHLKKRTKDFDLNEGSRASSKADFGISVQYKANPDQELKSLNRG